ncbi:hypothetical protein BD414DRAFT_484707 [Trametes punicea]|nr:hypothetical protein BD414DRAFT_484707 [Trametes punicea]
MRTSSRWCTRMSCGRRTPCVHVQHALAPSKTRNPIPCPPDPESSSEEVRITAATEEVGGGRGPPHWVCEEADVQYALPHPHEREALQTSYIGR